MGKIVVVRFVFCRVYILTSVTIIKKVFLRKLFCYESLVDIEVSKH